MTKRHRRMAFVAGVLVVAASAAALIGTALQNSIAYFYTPSDLRELAEPPQGIIRLGGLVEDGSVRFGDDAEVTFVVRDAFARLPVSYRGVLPDLFREGQGVVVQGRLQPGLGLEAVEVLAKHDETYMPREVAEALKEQGRWRGGDGR